MSADSSSLLAGEVKRLLGLGFSAVTASEIEFYMPGAQASGFLPSFWDDVLKACAYSGIGIHKIDKETGKDQHEISLTPSADPQRTAFDTHELRIIIAQAAKLYDLAADFSAKPFADQPGNGLHINVHLANAEGKNIFYKDDERICAPLLHSIGGLLAWLPDCMPVFAPLEESYTRFAAKSNGPLTVSWGGNNRTVAVRLPDTERDNKRIEHRVAGAEADPSLVIAVILAAIHYGITQRSHPGAPTFGDASLEMYNLPRLPNTLKDAVQRLEQSKVIQGYFSVSDLLPAR